jgi:calcineurin-like phosphoesterase family protein
MKVLGKTHLVIPDTQCKPGVRLQHLLWLGDYIADKRPDVIVHLGDHWDMPSLSMYDRGTKKSEGKRYVHDIAAGNLGMSLLMRPIIELNKKLRARHEPQYKPQLHFVMGNHEERILRHANANPNMAGQIGYKDFNLKKYGWKVHDFLHVAKIDGVSYAHYFAQPNTGKPWGGAAQLRLKNIGFSFTMGHQQGKQGAERYLQDGTAQRGLIVGSFYQHDEDYKGPQGNYHWRGVVMKHEVIDGNYDLMEVSLAFLEKRYRMKYPKRKHVNIVYEAPEGDEE